MKLKKHIVRLLVIATALSACKKNTQPKQLETITTNYDNYESNWKVIEKMEQEGLGKRIVSKVDSILSNALAEENTTQIFKALAYRSKYYNQLEEESNLKIFNQYEEQIANSSFPLKQLLHSATAELYHQYYIANRWEFDSRTTTESFDKQDLRTWSLDDILNKVGFHYQHSLTHEEDLLASPIDNLKDILHLPDAKVKLNQFDGKYLQPTLFDFLSNRALSYYQQNEGRVNAPQEEFKVDEYAIFSGATQFINIEFNTTDTNSNDLKTAQIFQKGIKAHLNDENNSPLLHLELKRLRHYFTSSQKANKDSLYLDALVGLRNTFATSKNASEIEYAIAKLYFEQGDKYNKEQSSEYRWNRKKAHSIALAAINETYGGTQCQLLVDQIEQRALKLQVEKVYLPSTKILYRIDAKNIDSLYFKLIRLPNSFGRDQEFESKSTDDYMKALYKRNATRTWTKHLDNSKDFREHSFEFTTDKLEKGKYVLVVSTERNFTTSTSLANSVDFQVSELSFISKNENKGVVDFYILNRENGQPTSNAKLTRYYYDYNYDSRKNQLKTLGFQLSDQNGFVQVTSKEATRNYKVSITTENDTLNEGGSFYSRYYPRRETKRKETFLFSDRAIYRPGQTVYFKGIVVERGKNSNAILANYNTTVKLYNVNGEVVNEIKVKTNDYGSYQASFVLPSSGLNGSYRLQTEGKMLSIQVEEYKRPTFEITIDTSKDAQKINKTILVSGTVVAYSGAKISDAKINYRIRRRTSFPWWGYWWRPIPRTGDKEIANGEIVADADGKFEFSFFAEADKEVSSKWNPNFNFDVSIDATSPSGETQSTTETISLGTKEVYLSSNLSKSLRIDELKSFVISAKNIQGVELERKLNFKLFRLNVPKTVDKSSYWNDAEYLENKLQPKKRNQLHEFERGPELLSGAIESGKQNDIIGDLPLGAYEIDVTTIGDEKSEFTHRFELYNEDSKQLAMPSDFEFKGVKMKAEPGEKASFVIGSSFTNLRLLYQVHLDEKIISQQWITLNNEQRKIEIPIKESYRGGLSISFIGIYNNRTIEHSARIDVPYTNKKLQLSLGTYRNKVEPGSKEKWSMTITGAKGEKVAAELLAGMYDQSLDQFTSTDWNMSLYYNNQSGITWRTDRSFGAARASIYGIRNQYKSSAIRVFPSLNWFGFSLNKHGRYMYADGMTMSMQKSVAYEVAPIMEADADYESEAAMSSNTQRGNSSTVDSKSNKVKTNPIRSDFRETAFFYPQLRTDKNGAVSFEFEMPDALTKWKFRALVHTKDLKIGTTETAIQTQKELMVAPTFPRFFREGDELNLKVLVTNLSDKIQNGTAQIQFFDAFTNQAINIASGLAADQKFNLFSGRNVALEWNIRIPEGIQAIKYKVTANSESFSDGEEKVIPVLSNRMLVTESLPLAIRGNQQKDFVFDKLVNNNSKTLKHESFTLEFTSNPAWYAVQALPYVVESTSECSEQIFTRLYANLLAQQIATSNPRVKEVFDLWKSADSEELTSKLMQNQELKSILIEETPWLRQAKSESEQKKRIALLFDFNNMAQEKNAALKRLKELQLPNGGWAWYNGMRDNRYITQYIIEGFGHLKQLGVDLSIEPGVEELINKSLEYLDNRIIEDYQWLQKNSKDLSKNHINSTQIHYLYTRSFFLEKEVTKNAKAFNYYLNQAEQYWLENNLYTKGMQALSIHRLNPSSNVPKTIVASLRDNALQTEQMGMYWKNNQAGYYWYNSPIETQALMVEVFHEVAKDKNAVEELRIWLLKEKQTQMWSNSKATALACYSLLIDNVKGLSSGNQVQVKVGQQLLNPAQTEAGTGYFKKVWPNSEVNPNMGAISVQKASDGIAWGAAYWQYYEDLDKITTAETEEFSVSKTIFKVVVDQNGERMIPIDVYGIEIGDRIRIRLKIESKRNLEFVHLKDMRASGLEPIKVISRYKFQDGLGYYESTKDASTNFFMDYLAKGTYVFEYDLRATVGGNFSNGICSLQCQYAPEFSAHSKGKQLTI